MIRRVRYGPVIAVVFAAWMLGSEAQRSAAIIYHSLRGAGYAEHRWRSSELGVAMLEARDHGRVYTNRPAFAWIRGIDTRCFPAALVNDPCDTGRQSDLQEVLTRMRGRSVFLAWFNDGPQSGHPNPATAQCPPVRLLEIKKLEDGQLYRALPGCASEPMSLVR